jgi:hypothetical protein
MLLAGLIAGAVGLVLFVVELAVVLADNTLGTLGAILLWLGVALIVAAGVLFLLAVLSASDDRSSASDGVQPTDG